MSISLEPRIDWLALQRDDREHAFVDPTKRFLADEPLQPLDTERNLRDRDGEDEFAA